MVVENDSVTHLEELLKTSSAGQEARGQKPKMVFQFPGQGKFFDDLGKGLYTHEPVFREWADRCCAMLAPRLGLKITDLMFGDGPDPDRLRQPEFWQAALFVSEYAFAQVLIARGLTPESMIGHSIGEYVAATLAGVLRLEDGLALIAERGRLTATLPRGAMLAVFLAEDKLAEYVREPLSLAAVNGPALSVVAGPEPEIAALQTNLKRARIRSIRLEAQHAFHSSMMDPIMRPLADLAAAFKLSPPKIPFISNVTGTWMTEEDACDPAYWSRHMRQTVRFNDGLDTLLTDPGRIFVEIGPGHVLANLVKHHPANKDHAFACLGFKGASMGLDETLITLGKSWELGYPLDWSAFSKNEHRTRIPLPLYPFERKSHWLDPGQTLAVSGANPLETKRPLEDWFYLPSWKPSPLATSAATARAMKPGGCWLLFMDGQGVSARLADRLEEYEQTVIRVERGDGFAQLEARRYAIDPIRHGDYSELFKALVAEKLVPGHVIHGFRLDPEPPEREGAAVFDGLIHLASALAVAHPKCRVAVLSAGMQAVAPREPGQADRSTVLGPVRVIPAELADVSCISIDLEDHKPGERVLGQVLSEAARDRGQDVVAYRGGLRWTEGFEPIEVGEDPITWPLRRDGVFLITNALQEMGLILAEHLLATTRAELVLLDRLFFPKPEEWEAWLEEQGGDDVIGRLIKRVRTMPRERVRVATVNPADGDAMRGFAKDHPVKGVFYLEHHSDGGLIQTKPAAGPSPILSSKLAELRLLGELFADADFTVLFSENPGEGGLGHVEQAAAHAFTDHFAESLIRRNQPVFCIDWGTRGWEDAEAAADPVQRQLKEKRALFGMTPDEFFEALTRILSWGPARVIVSTREYGAVLEQQRTLTAAFFQEQFKKADHDTVQARPDLATPYAAPQSETERVLTEQWAYYFGVDKVGVDDSFFELGGHSLLAVQMLNKLTELFSMEIPVQQLFETPTIAELAAFIDGSVSAEPDELDMEALLAEIEGLSEQETLTAIETETGS